jgi:hypothetical protein
MAKRGPIVVERAGPVNVASLNGVSGPGRYGAELDDGDPPVGLFVPATPQAPSQRVAVGPTEQYHGASREIVRTTGNFGDPSVRLAELTRQFGANGIFTLVCDSDYAPLMDAIVQRIAARLP